MGQRKEKFHRIWESILNWTITSIQHISTVEWAKAGPTRKCRASKPSGFRGFLHIMPRSTRTPASLRQFWDWKICPEKDPALPSSVPLLSVPLLSPHLASAALGSWRYPGGARAGKMNQSLVSTDSCRSGWDQQERRIRKRKREGEGAMGENPGASNCF